MKVHEKMKLLESDLRDSSNPELLKKYPHLGSESLKKQTTDRLEALKAMDPDAEL